MNNQKTYTVPLIFLALGVIITLVILGVAGVFSNKAVVITSDTASNGESLGAVTPYEELYNPNLSRNQKYYSALPIELTGASGDITTGDDLTVTDDASVGGTLTVTGATDSYTFTQGGGITATSSVAVTATLAAAEFDTENWIQYMPAQSITLTLPATSTLIDFIPTIGDTREVLLENTSTTTEVTITLAAGTGMSLQYASTSPVILPTHSALLKFWRSTTTDIIVQMFETGNF